MNTFIVRRALRVPFVLFKFLVVFAVFSFLIQRSTYPLGITWNAVSAIVRHHQFDYVSWELNALATKTSQALWGVHPFMEEAERSQFVRDYMADLTEAQRLEAEIQTIFVDPDVADADTATADLRDQRDTLRADLGERQAIMESILEGQVASVLVDEGFGVLGQLVPPISMHFTQVPNLLVVSPRDEIDLDIGLNLDPMPLEEIEAVEQQIEQEHDMAALVVPIGGMALFPAMIFETSNLPWAIETFAHEWVHHYLFMFPLGWAYNSGEARIINETAADMFGKEIGVEVLRRYYPELAPAASHGTETVLVSDSDQERPVFDFGRTMHITRTNVDHMLENGREMEAKAEDLANRGRIEYAQQVEDYKLNYITKAERFMEDKREIFYDNGYRIRELNQAYFAFYGGYQGGIPGIGGRDPIGPAMREIRENSPSLKAFVDSIRSITTREEVLALRDELVAQGPHEQSS